MKGYPKHWLHFEVSGSNFLTVAHVLRATLRVWPYGPLLRCVRVYRPYWEPVARNLGLPSFDCELGSIVAWFLGLLGFPGKQGDAKFA